ncbi:mersacidin/lichenicidin family type 2 lantibiotic [Amycolatopsis pigmentata]|uniref:Mersacidin/lichenicidin family type 2 lantibiotic n=1 Tax=Amycolatopsis pigmentata TaxID=450801 RepID=A0ABW5FYE9_9PSEU
MSTDVMVRAWKEPRFREGLTGAQLATLPAHPSGEGFGELDAVGLKTTPEAAFVAYSGGMICTLTLECPLVTMVCC